MFARVHFLQNIIPSVEFPLPIEFNLVLRKRILLSDPHR